MMGLTLWRDRWHDWTASRCIGVGREGDHVVFEVDSDGGMSNTRAVSPTQAREIAAYLVQLADEIDGDKDE